MSVESWHFKKLIQILHSNIEIFVQIINKNINIIKNNKK